MAIKRKMAHLARFGTTIGLTFGSRGGNTVISIASAEIRRLLEVWHQAETTKRKPDPEILTALTLLGRKARNLDNTFVLECPIAQRKARILPLVSDDDPLQLF